MSDHRERSSLSLWFFPSPRAPAGSARLHIPPVTPARLSQQSQYTPLLAASVRLLLPKIMRSIYRQRKWCGTKGDRE